MPPLSKHTNFGLNQSKRPIYFGLMCMCLQIRGIKNISSIFIKLTTLLRLGAYFLNIALKELVFFEDLFEKHDCPGLIS